MFKEIAAVALVSAVLAAPAAATTIDFTSITPGTAISTQYPGLTFSLVGGQQPGTPTVDRAFGTNTPPTLGNSTTDNYPTGTAINIAFAGLASGISFTFSNFGNNSGFAPSNYTAFGAGNSVVSTGNLGNVQNLTLVPVAGSNILNLLISNGSNGTYSWLYGIGELTYELDASAAVPEPASWAMMIGGFGAAGIMIRRRRHMQKDRLRVA